MSTLPIITIQTHTVQGAESELEEQTPSHDAPLPKGDRNENPRGVKLFALLAEDFRTYDRDIFEPAFWAVAIHRFGNALMTVPARSIYSAAIDNR